jgi:pimeloyl-ACP methyl ester carboxylesterase
MVLALSNVTPVESEQTSEQRHTIVRNGAHVRERGERGAGVPILFLHGNPDTCEMWDGVVQRMAAHHRCVTPDLPGFGRSAVPSDFDCSLDGWSAWVDEVVRDRHGPIDTGPIDLVVHDFGGLFGLAWAVRHPERVRRLAILNTMFFPEYRWHFWARVWRTPLLGELSVAVSTRTGLALEMRRGSKRLPMAYANKAYDVMTPLMKRTMLRLYRAADPERFTPWQPGLAALMARVPALVLWGDLDPYLDKSLAERFHATRVHHFPHNGHWLPVEDPAAVATHLLAFFAND